MKIVRDADVNVFLKNTESLLYQREAEYGLMLGLAEGIQKRPVEGFNPIFLRAMDESNIARAAFIQTRVENGVITHAQPSEIDLIVEKLMSEKPDIKGIVGPPMASEGFAKCFAKTQGSNAKLVMSQKILKLVKVISPRSCEGLANQATLNDLELVAAWVFEFLKEAVPHEHHDPSKLQKLAEARVANGDIYLWKVDQNPVAMASVGRPTKTGIAVNAVYTPLIYRGHGYASNLVAKVSQKMLDEGRAFCVLYTDASNPTANKIYQGIGYQIIGDAAYYLL